jgi:hypothetical protein
MVALGIYGRFCQHHSLRISFLFLENSQQSTDRFARILPQHDALWNKLLTFVTSFSNLNVSKGICDLLLLLADHCANLFASHAVIEAFLRLWRFHECFMAILRPVQDGECLFSRLVDEDVAGMLRDAFQDSGSAPSALKATGKLVFLDRNHTFTLFLDHINSPHYIIPEW